MIDQIQWLGYGGFVIQGPPLIYINPWRLIRATFLADVILVGHGHDEHYSPTDIARLRSPDTVILTNDAVAAELPGAEALRDWHSRVFDRARITALPAYSPTSQLHRREDGGLGFLISINYYDIYYAGDTQIIPEMARIAPDIAILPIDGNGTLTVEEAAEVISTMRPRWVIPCNWGAGGIGQSEVDRFKSLVGERSQVHIPTIMR